jgi:hypothetical protein
MDAVAWAAGPEGKAAGIRVINLSLAMGIDPAAEGKRQVPGVRQLSAGGVTALPMSQQVIKDICFPRIQHRAELVLRLNSASTVLCTACVVCIR